MPKLLTTPTIKIGEGEAQPGRIIINGADLTWNILSIRYSTTPGLDLLVRAGWTPPDGDPLCLQAKKLVPSESDGA